MPKSDSRSGGVVTALIYTRVSKDEQAREGLSLDAQLAECRRYATAQGWVLGDEYQDILKGTRDDRPQYQALLTEVRRLRAAGRPLAVVVAALDRFGRALLERVRCREELKALGVPTHSVREGGEVSDIVANVLAAVAQEEVRRLGERIRATNQYIASGGWHHVGWAPWGYRWRQATDEERRAGAPNAVLEVDHCVAPYVREAFDRLAAGDSMRSVAYWLAQFPEAVRQGRSMRYSGVRVILTSRAAVGQLPDGRHGRWPALVDEETWKRAQEQITRHQLQPKQASKQYLLTGFLHCERCGARMGGWHQRGRPAYYRCYGQQQGSSAPNLRCYYTARLEGLDNAVLSSVADLVEVLVSREPRLQRELRSRWAAHQQPDDRAVQSAATIQNLKCEAEKARQRLTNAAVLLVDGTIDKGGYELLRDKAQVDLDAAEAEIARLSIAVVPPPVLPPLDAVVAAAGSWRRMLHESDTAARRDVLAQLVASVQPRRVSFKHYEVVIVWTPLGETLKRLAQRDSAA